MSGIRRTSVAIDHSFLIMYSVLLAHGLRPVYGMIFKKRLHCQTYCTNEHSLHNNNKNGHFQMLYFHVSSYDKHLCYDVVLMQTSVVTWKITYSITNIRNKRCIEPELPKYVESTTYLEELVRTLILIARWRKK